MLYLLGDCVPLLCSPLLIHACFAVFNWLDFQPFWPLQLDRPRLPVPPPARNPALVILIVLGWPVWHTDWLQCHGKIQTVPQFQYSWNNQQSVVCNAVEIMCFNHTGCLYKLSPIKLVWGPLKCSKSEFNPVHVFLHFKSFVRWY